MPRGRVLRPEDMSAQQREVYDRIRLSRANPSRPEGPIDEDGSLRGPFNAMLYSPTVGVVLGDLGEALRFKGTLDDLTRELVVCRVATEYESAYEWNAHARLARAAGADDAQLDALAAGEPVAGVPETTEAALALAGSLLDRESLTDEAYAEYHALLGEAGLFEVSSLVGYYGTIAQQMDLFGVQP